MPDGPKLERKIDPNKPNATFELSEQTVRSEDKAANLRSKYPQANKILSEQPKITVRELADLLGVAPSTAHGVKDAWEEVLSKPEPEKPAVLETVREQIGAQISTLLPGTGILTNKEADEYREILPAVLSDDFRYLDEYLWSRQEHALPNFSEADKKPIWSDLDDDETMALANILIKAGKRSPAAATMVRAAAESHDYIVTAVIVGPRVKKTFQIVRATHQAPVSRLARRQIENQH